MGKFRTATPLPPAGVLATLTPEPDTLTAEHGRGWSRDARSELFLLAVTNMVGEDTFYEKGKDRDERFRSLISTVAHEDPDWLVRFIPYLRNTLNMRSASIVMAAELVANRLEARGGLMPDAKTMSKTNRQVIDSALQRADEPGEMVGYWHSRYGKHLPMPVRRGIADACNRLYTENAYLKYGAGDGIRMADVLEIVHPKTRKDWQNALYRHMLDERHNRGKDVPELLPRVKERRWLDSLPAAERDVELLKDLPGVTWEWASSWYGRALDESFWTALAPQLGYMALLRNLRNLDGAGVPDEQAGELGLKLADPEEVARSRQLPMRFYSAYKAAGLRWHYPLEKALNAALANVPALHGRTLILVDGSISMNAAMSGKSALSRRDAAAVFGAALALRAEHPTLIAYADQGVQMPVSKGGSVLPLARDTATATNGGTDTFGVLTKHYSGHDRVIILTDEQAFDGDVSGITCPIYTFNLAGYKAAHLPAEGKHYTFGGLTDAGFTAIASLERGKDERWPF